MTTKLRATLTEKNMILFTRFLFIGQNQNLEVWKLVGCIHFTQCLFAKSATLRKKNIYRHKKFYIPICFKVFFVLIEGLLLGLLNCCHETTIFLQNLWTLYSKKEKIFVYSIAIITQLFGLSISCRSSFPVNFSNQLSARLQSI